MAVGCSAVHSSCGGVGPRDRKPILGDRNPVIDAALAGERIPAISGSFNHGGRGQNILDSDGRAFWLERPVIRQDNIWLPHGQTQLHRGDRPQTVGDVFLAH